jgi:hypothetical protein
MARFSFESVARTLLGIYRSLGTPGQPQGYHDPVKQPSEGRFQA